MSQDGDLLLRPLPKEGAKGAKYRQITHHLRGLISRGDLKPGTRLPPIKTLAQQWNTNYFTVRLALTPLANEGLIERTPGSGTFVLDRKTQLSSVGIFYGGNLWTDPEGTFYQRAYYSLQGVLAKRDMRCTTFIDTRAPREHANPLPELRHAVERREVHAVIGLMLTTEDADWLEKLDIPVSLFGGRGFHTDRKSAEEKALDRLAAEGCKTVGMICRDYSDPYPAFEEEVKARGMKTSPNWVRYDCPDMRSEEWGYHSFRHIWAQQGRPDGLIIHPDWICRGAITAILELGVRVPENLRVVLYRNAGLEYLCPWKVPYLVFDLGKLADTMVDSLAEQYRSGKLHPIPPPLSLDLVG